jgi:hypothetical protein
MSRHTITRRTAVAVAGLGVALSSFLVGAGPAQAVNSNWSCQYISGPIGGGSMNAYECQGAGTGTGWIYVPSGEYRCYVITATPDSPTSTFYALAMKSCIVVS